MPRNFWKDCPRQLEFYPETACPLGKQAVEIKGDLAKKEEFCTWYINSEEDHYCFWVWLKRVSNKDGFFEPLLVQQMAKLLKCSSNKFQIVFKNAFASLEDLEEFQELKSYY
jgi:hypothetical protein